MVRGRVRGFEEERGLVVAERLGPPAERVEAEAPVIERLEVARIPRQRRRVVLDGAPEVRELAPAERAVVVEVGDGELARRARALAGDRAVDRRREVEDGVLRVAEALVRDAPVVPRERARPAWNPNRFKIPST